MIYLIGAAVCFLVMLFVIVYEHRNYSVSEMLDLCGYNILVALVISMIAWYLVIPMYVFKLIVNIWGAIK